MFKVVLVETYFIYIYIYIYIYIIYTKSVTLNINVFFCLRICTRLIMSCYFLETKLYSRMQPGNGYICY